MTYRRLAGAKNVGEWLIPGAIEDGSPDGSNIVGSVQHEFHDSVIDPEIIRQRHCRIVQERIEARRTMGSDVEVACGQDQEMGGS